MLSNLKDIIKMDNTLQDKQNGYVLLREPTSLWRENVVAVIIQLRVLAKMS